MWEGAELLPGATSQAYIYEQAKGVSSEVRVGPVEPQRRSEYSPRCNLGCTSCHSETDPQRKRPQPSGLWGTVLLGPCFLGVTMWPVSITCRKAEGIRVEWEPSTVLRHCSKCALRVSDPLTPVHKQPGLLETPAGLPSSLQTMPCNQDCML